MGVQWGDCVWPLSPHRSEEPRIPQLSHSLPYSVLQRRRWARLKRNSNTWVVKTLEAPAWFRKFRNRTKDISEKNLINLDIWDLWANFWYNLINDISEMYEPSNVFSNIIFWDGRLDPYTKPDDRQLVSQLDNLPTRIPRYIYICNYI